MGIFINISNTKFTDCSFKQTQPEVLRSPARQQHRQLVNGGFPLYGEAVVLADAVDLCITAGHDLPEVSERHPQSLEQAAVKLLELLPEGDAPQPVGHMQGLSQTHPEEREAPQEGGRRAQERPCPERGAEEAQREEGEQVEQPVEPAAAHEAEEEEDVSEVEDGALRAVPPLLAHLRLRRRVHGFEVRTLYVDSVSLRIPPGPAGWLRNTLGSPQRVEHRRHVRPDS